MDKRSPRSGPLVEPTLRDNRPTSTVRALIFLSAPSFRLSGQSRIKLAVAIVSVVIFMEAMAYMCVTTHQRM